MKKTVLFFAVLVAGLIGFAVYMGLLDKKNETTEVLPKWDGALSGEVVKTPRPAPSAAVKIPVTGLIEDGDAAVSAILDKEELSTAEAAREMLVLLPRLKPDDQSAAVQHITNLCDDAVAADFIPLLVSNRYPQDVAEALFDELVNHEGLQLRAAAAIVDGGENVLKKEAIEALADGLTGPAEGTNWKEKVDFFLKNQPAEAAPIPVPALLPRSEKK